MKLIKYISIVILLISCSDNSENRDKEAELQEYEPIFLADGIKRIEWSNSEMAYGIKNSKGEYVIKPKFSALKDFSEGLALARPINSDLYGYINTQGKWVIKPMFYRAYPFSEGLATIQMDKNGDYGFINRNGDFVIRPVYDLVPMRYYFQNGFVCVDLGKNEGGHNYLNRQGKLLIPPGKFGLIETNTFFTKNGLALISTSEGSSKKYTVINNEGNEVFSFSSCENCFARISDDIIMMRYYDTNDGLYEFEFFNSKGEFLYKFPKGKIAKVGEPIDNFFVEGLAIFNLPDDKFGFFNKKGEIVIAPVYDYAFPFKNGLSSVEMGGRYGVIDKTDRLIIKPFFYYKLDFNQYGEAKIGHKQNHLGWVNREGELIGFTLEDLNKKIKQTKQEKRNKENAKRKQEELKNKQELEIVSLKKEIQSLKEENKNLKNSKAKIVIKEIPVSGKSQSRLMQCTYCNGTGRCSNCGGDGEQVCPMHDTNGDGNCTECKNIGFVNCWSCIGNGKCSSCGGDGKY